MPLSGPPSAPRIVGKSKVPPQRGRAWLLRVGKSCLGAAIVLLLRRFHQVEGAQAHLSYGELPIRPTQQRALSQETCVPGRSKRGGCKQLQRTAWLFSSMQGRKRRLDSGVGEGGGIARLL